MIKVLFIFLSAFVFCSYSQGVTGTICNSKDFLKKVDLKDAKIQASSKIMVASNSHVDLSSTLVWVQQGDEIRQFSLLQEDYDSLNLLIQELVEINRELNDSSIPVVRKRDLIEHRRLKIAEYNQLLGHSIERNKQGKL